MRMSLVLVVFALLACGEDSSSDVCTKAPQKSNPVGLPHGYACTAANECQYGVCDLSSVATGATFGICTKDCSCGVNSECGIDDVPAEGLSYTCIRPSGALPSCVLECSSLEDCTKVSDRYTACTNTPPGYAGGSIGVQKFCVAGP